MKKYAAAAIIAALALTGCAGASAQRVVSYTPAPASAVETTPTMTEHVLDRWVGPNAPDAQWVESAVLLVCKRTIGGLELNVLPDYFYAEKNTGILLDAAMKYECGEILE